MVDLIATSPDTAPVPAVADVAARLRAALMPLLSAVGGQPIRPVHLTRGIGLDKSLSSRLTQASRAETDAQFLHLLPSPTGLRILIERSRAVDAALPWQPALAAAVDDFARLLDTLPGGRQTLDARLGTDLAAIRDRREQMARQASFKAVSFLFGHACDTLSTTLFLFPSADSRFVDAVEVHRRIGLRRIAPGTAVPLLSVLAPSLEGSVSTTVTPVAGRTLTAEGVNPHDYLIAEASSRPLPDLDIEMDGPNQVFLLGASVPEPLPDRLTTAFRMRQVEPAQPEQAYRLVRNYMLHTPCQRLVREVFVAEGLWPNALPQWGSYLPGPTGGPMVAPPPDQPHFRRLNLHMPLEQLPLGPTHCPLTGVNDHAQALDIVLRRAGLSSTHFRGWRCQIAYPVPLVEMQLGFRFVADASLASR